MLFFYSASWKRRRVTHWPEQLCLDSYRQRKISQSDCEIRSNCGKTFSWQSWAKFFWLNFAVSSAPITLVKRSTSLCHSGAPAARRAVKRSPIPIAERKGNPWIVFLMVIMVSGIAREHVRTKTTTTTTESRKMAAILQLICWQRHAPSVCRVPLWYWKSMLWSIDTCQNKVSADQYHVTISRAQV